MGKTGELVELADSPLSGNVRMFTDYDPEWEVEPSALNMLEKIGECLCLCVTHFVSLTHIALVSLFLCVATLFL